MKKKDQPPACLLKAPPYRVRYFCPFCGLTVRRDKRTKFCPKGHRIR